MPLFEHMAGNPAALISITALLGLLVGSFLNVVIYRVPIMLQRDWTAQCHELLNTAAATTEDHTEPFNLIYPRSCCPHCRGPIRAWQNIPVLSYLLLRGRCAHCRANISARYPLVETAAALLSGLVVWHFGASWQGAAMLLLSWVLLALSLIDFDHQLLPDNMTLPLMWLGLIANSFGLFCSLQDALWGAVVGYLSLWSVYWLFKLITGKEGMGYGDFKLLAMLGAWLGWEMLPLIILLSSLVGAVVGIALMVFKNRGQSIPIPFGPYLAAAGWIAALWGEQMVLAYLRFAGLHA